MTRITIVLLLAVALGLPAAAQDSERSTSASAKASASAKPTASTPVNLNTATAAQLEALPGIGKATAERILAYRQKNGGFKKVEDLMNIQGVGEKSFLKLKPLVTVSAKTERSDE